MKYSRVIFILLLLCTMILQPGMGFAEEGESAPGPVLAASAPDHVFEQGSKKKHEQCACRQPPRQLVRNGTPVQRTHEG